MPKFKVYGGKDAWAVYLITVEVFTEDGRLIDEPVMTAISTGDPKHILQLTGPDVDTVLAALRFWQREGLSSAGHEITDIATSNGSHPALTVKDIDDLCEEINCG